MSQRFTSIVEYIEYHLGRGVSEERLRQHLQDKLNWTPERVNRAFELYFETKTPAMPGLSAEPAKKKRSLKPKRPGKKALIALVAVMMLPSGTVFGMNYFKKFEDVTYNNRLGASYQLKFYNRYKEVNKDIPLLESDQKGWSVQLASGQASGGSSPFVFGIKNYPLENDPTGALAMVTSDCSSQDNLTPKAFTVFNGQINKDINVCAVRRDKSKLAGDGDTVYAATFSYGNRKHHLSIMQEGPNQGPGLQVYEDDIKQIVASVLPLNK